MGVSSVRSLMQHHTHHGMVVQKCERIEVEREVACALQPTWPTMLGGKVTAQHPGSQPGPEWVTIGFVHIAYAAMHCTTNLGCTFRISTQQDCCGGHEGHLRKG